MGFRSLRKTEEELLLEKLGLSGARRGPSADATTFTSPDPLTIPTIGGTLTERAPVSPIQRALAPQAVAPSIRKAQKGSGESLKAENVNTAKSRELVKELLTLGPDQFAEASGLIQGTNEFQNQKGDVERIRALTRAQAQVPAGLDISSILALVDAQTGSKLAQSFRKPESSGAQAQRLLSGALSDERAGRNLSQTLLDGISKLKSGTLERLDEGLSRSSVTAGSTDPKLKGSGGPTATSLLNARRQIDKVATDRVTKITDAATQFSNEFVNLDAAIKGGTLNEVTASLALLARGFSGEKGVLAQRDIDRILTPTLGMTFAQLKGFITSNPNQPVPEEVKKSLNKIIVIGRRNADKKFKLRLKQAKEQTTKMRSFRDAGLTKVDGDALFQPAEDTLKAIEPGKSDRQKRIDELKKKAGLK